MEPTQNPTPPIPNNNLPEQPPVQPGPAAGAGFGQPPALTTQGPEQHTVGQPLQPAAIYPNPAAGPTAAPAVEDDQKDYVVAFLLSWLLGGMGADRFYLGYTKSGIVKLITLGGLGVWVIIDVWRLAFGKLKDRSGLPLKGYEKNKSWTKALAIIHLLVFVLVIGLIFVSLFLTTKLGVQQKARDAERQTDINALQGALELYKSNAGKYPTLDEFNSSGFRQQHMQGLPDSALQDPDEHTPTLLASPGFAGYAYEPLPSGCDNDGAGNCTSYTLTATLDAGGNYVRSSQ